VEEIKNAQASLPVNAGWYAIAMRAKESEKMAAEEAAANFSGLRATQSQRTP